MKKTLLRLALAVAVVVLALMVMVPVDAERWFGPAPAANRGRADLDPNTLERHRRLFVADLHADPLIWSRDLLARGLRGHTDVPRMQAGGIDLQLFMAVTDAPLNSRLERIARGFDQLQLLSVVDRWPMSTWTSRKARALYMAQRLHGLAERSSGQFVLVRSKPDLRRLREVRVGMPTPVGGLLGIEGSEPLEGSVANLAALFDAGFRVMGLAHYWDSDIGGSSSGERQSGLTATGTRLVREMEARGMTVDLAHASEQAAFDALRIATHPVLATHVGVRALCPHSRNLSDDLIRAIAANDGVIGIGFFPEVTCGTETADIVRSIKYLRDLVGARHVALGSGFDAPVQIPIDAAGMPELSEALRDAGLSDNEVAQVMGENVSRVLENNLPDIQAEVSGEALR